MRRFMPVLCAVALLGCAESHENGDGGGSSPDAGADGGSPMRDAGAAVDAATCSIVAVRPTAVCDVAEGPAGRALVVTMEGCYCGEQLACAGSIVGDRVQVEVSFEECADVLCDECGSLFAPCDLGEDVLGPDAYEVEINGAPALRLPGLLEPVVQPSCYNPAPEPPESFLCGYPDGSVSLASTVDVCVPEVVSRSESFVIRVRGCVDCFDESAGCAIYASPGAYEVQPLRRACDCPVCGACSPECVEKDFFCELPALYGDDLVTVRVAGEDHVVSAASGRPGENRACAE